MTSRFSFDGRAEIIAHRGFSAEAPENTLAAMELAIGAGCDALEFDLHVSADGVPHLIHDETLGRTTDGSGHVREADAADLARLDAGSWFGTRFRGEPVPTLESALSTVRGRVARVYAELKGYRTPADVELVVEVVTRCAMLDRTVFISMDWDALERVREAAPGAAIGYIVEDAARVGEALARATGDGGAMLDFDGRVLAADPTAARRAARAGVPLGAWTVNRTRDAARLLELGVPRITTNEVERLVAWKRTL